MTQQLPPALARWRRELSLFPLELALELGGIIRRLSSAIGPPVATRHRGDDPDGYDGIVRSGPYDRMLHSEWLLADELPDEFLRRAIMNEQLFFRIARRSPLDDLMSVALFDAGPSQLGAPRIVHIALLLVLAQRCAERGGTFRWAVLQQHPRVTHERVDADAVRSLLEARSAFEIDEAGLDEWLDLLPHGDRRHRETWLVGGTRLAALIERHTRASVAGRDFREASVVSIDEPLDVRDHTLQARVRTPVRRQDVTLPLPSNDATTRLLRDPFAGTRSAPAPSHVAVPPPEVFFFTAEGKRIVARAPQGGVRVYNLSSGSAHVKEYGALRGNPVIAAGWGRTRGGASISIQRWPQRRLVVGPVHRQRRTVVVNAPDYPWDAELASLNRIRPVVPSSATSYSDYLFLDVHGDCWMTGVERFKAERIARGVLALGSFRGVPYIARNQDEWRIEKIDGGAPRVIVRHAGAGPGAFFGAAPHDEEAHGMLIALQESEDRWLVTSSQSIHSYSCPPGARVIGVAVVAHLPALIFVEKRQLSAAAGTDLRVLLRTENPIDAAQLDPVSMRAAVVSNGELVVHDLQQGKALWRFRSTR